MKTNIKIGCEKSIGDWLYCGFKDDKGNVDLCPSCKIAKDVLDFVIKEIDRAHEFDISHYGLKQNIKDKLGVGK